MSTTPEIKKFYRLYSAAKRGFCKGNISKYRSGFHDFTQEEKGKIFYSERDVAKHISLVLSCGSSGIRFYKDIIVIEYSFIISKNEKYTDFIKNNEYLIPNYISSRITEIIEKEKFDIIKEIGKTFTNSSQTTAEKLDSTYPPTT